MGKLSKEIRLLNRLIDISLIKLATGSHSGRHKSFLDKNYPEKAKEIYKALKRDHPNMPKEVRARIALRKSKKSPKSRKPPETGGPKYKAPLHYVRRKGRYVKKKAFDTLMTLLSTIR